MKMGRWVSMTVAVVIGLGLFLAGTGWVTAQTDQDADRLQEEVDTAIDTRQQTQQQMDDWSAEKAALVQRFRSAKAAVAWLEERQAEETARVEAVEARVAELSRRMLEAERLESSIEDTLGFALQRLEDSIAASLPFLPEERAGRVALLRSELVQPDVTAAEKLRRVLEALQVETAYGSTVEVYQDRIEIGGEALHVDILRLGRLALFWRTPDMKRVGHYDPAGATWAELDGSYRRNIGLAMEMASRMRPVEIIDLPVGRIAP